MLKLKNTFIGLTWLTLSGFSPLACAKKIIIYRSDWKLEVWKMMERFGILAKFEARFVDLPNLRFSRLTKPTGLTKSPGLTRLTRWLDWLDN